MSLPPRRAARCVPVFGLLLLTCHEPPGPDPAGADRRTTRQALAADEPTLVTRGPYLQMGGPTGVTVRWRTAGPVRGRLIATRPSAPDLGPLVLDEPAAVTEHVLTVTGLVPETRYDYTLGSTDQPLTGDEDRHFFITAPPVGLPRPTRIWVIGDSGMADHNAAAVYNAYLGFTGERHTDLWLMLGDNAYLSGTDEQYQAAVFDLYRDLLPNVFLWTAIGNHENWTPGGGPYLNIFSLPTRGEAGGLASGSELYYSFDHANMHFVVLDSEISSRAVDGPMLRWLDADLQATQQPWVIALFHHPPYSKGHHDSDDPLPTKYEFQLVEMRERVVPILEAHGVDLVLNGHSHAYERSYLLHGHHGLSTTLDGEMKRDHGSGQPDDNGAYRKFSASGGVDEGAVYVVAGSSSLTTEPLGRHPAMYTSLLRLGSLILDVQGLQLEATFIDHTGEIRDEFVINKGIPAATEIPGRPRALTAIPDEDQKVNLSWSYSGRDETGFLIERAAEGAPFSAWKRLGANATEFVDHKVPYGTRVWYRLRATNAAGASGPSNEAGVQLLDPATTDPGPPAPEFDAAPPPASAGVRGAGGGGCTLGGPHDGTSGVALVLVAAALVLVVARRPRRRRPLTTLLAGLLATMIGGGGPARADAPQAELLEVLNAEIARSPRVASNYLLRSEVYQRHGELDAALADLRRAADLEPRVPGLDLQMARALLAVGRPEAGHPYLDRALDTPGTRVAALLLRGRWRLGQGQAAGAADDLQAALAARGPAATPDDHLLLVSTLRQSRQLDRAAGALEAARRQLGPVVSIELVEIDLALERGQHDRALASIDRLIAASPHPEPFLVRRGHLLLAAGRPAQARRAFATALEALAPNDPRRRDTPARRRLVAEARQALARLR